MRTDRAYVKQAVEVYARTLFEAATRDNTVAETEMALRDALSYLRGHSDLRWTLRDVLVSHEVRKQILREVMAALHTGVVGLLEVMVEREEIQLLSAVVDSYADIADREAGVVVVDVTTAVPLDDALRASLSQRIAATLDRSVALRQKVDERIMGGIVIGVNGKVLDASVATQLETARTVLATPNTGGEA
jgi:F-type H+-transporting ATPase subunit delta